VGKQRAVLVQVVAPLPGSHRGGQARPFTRAAQGDGRDVTEPAARA
jgi:hypothetical protein